MKGLDGEKAWKEFINSLPTGCEKRYHRLNLRLQGAEPPIDDINNIHLLKQQTLHSLKSDVQLSQVWDSIYAALFYFELEAYPTFENSMFNCSGNIFCRLHLPPQGRQALYEQLCSRNAYFIILGHPISCVETRAKPAHFFKRRVRFSVSDLSDVVSISIKGSVSDSCSISGLPKQLARLIALQQLESPFGRIDHMTPEKPLPRLPYKRRFSDSDVATYF